MATVRTKKASKEMVVKSVVKSVEVIPTDLHGAVLDKAAKEIFKSAAKSGIDVGEHKVEMTLKVSADVVKEPDYDRDVTNSLLTVDSFLLAMSKVNPATRAVVLDAMSKAVTEKDGWKNLKEDIKEQVEKEFGNFKEVVNKTCSGKTNVTIHELTITK